MPQGARKAIERLIGEIRWRAPPWLAMVSTARRERPRRFWGVVGIAMVLLLLAGAGYATWRLLPEPVLTQVAVSAPDVTRIGEDGKLYPQPVTLQFETTYPDPTRQGPRNAARLDLLGKTLTQGVRLEPAHAGTWRWVDENTLRFTPEEDWPAGQRYRVHLSPELFAPGIELAVPTPAFTTPGIEATVEKLELYQNPKQPSEHRVVATLRFTHAVDPKSLKSHLSLTMRPSGAAVDTAPRSYAHSFELDKHRRVAYVTSEPLPLPAQDNFMTLELRKGVASAHGRSVTGQTWRDEVRIPAVSTFFRVESFSAQIVRNSDNEPVQTLLLEVTDGIEAAQVAEQLEAYLLPTGEAWQRGEVTRQVIARSERIELSANPTPHRYAKLLSFRFHAPPGRQMAVILPAGLVSRGGFTMTVPYRDVLRTPDYPVEVNIVGEGGLLALSGSHTIALQARGVPALKAQVYRLQNDQFVHLITQTRGDIEKAEFISYQFDEDNIGRRLERVLPLRAASPGEAVYTSLDLSRYLADRGLARGMFVVRVRGWDPVHQRFISGADDRRFILLTDLGVLAKSNADRSHDLFVHSLATGQPVAGARVTLLGVNGQPVFATTTDARGHARFPDVRDFEGGREPAVYVVSYRGDVSFLPFQRAGRQLNFSRFEVGGLRTAHVDEAEQLRAMVFTDRGVYRPGDRGHLGVIVKRNDWGRVAGVPVAIVLQGPRGDTLRRERMALPASGFVEMSFRFGRNHPTGTYRAAVYLLDDDHDRQRWLGDVEFSVEMFRPDTLRIDTAIAGERPAGWHTALEYRARVRLENLFGLPAQQHRVEGEYTLAPARFDFDAYPGFVFTDPFRDDEDRLQRSVTRKLAAVTTDGEGRAGFDIELSQYGRGVYQLVFTAKGFETGGGRSVSASTRIRVSPAERLVGWKTDSNLDYLRRGSRHEIRFIAIDPRLERIAAPDLTLRLVARRQVSTLVRQDDGTLQYQTVTKRVPVTSQPFDIATDGSRWRVPTDTPGDYVAEVVGAEGRVLAGVEFTVAGERNLTGSATREARLRIDLDQDSYRPGERIELQITAPYTGAGLITIERDRVYAFKWFSTDTQRTVQHIRVPENLEGNAYVNVTFVRALDSREIFTRPLSYAVAPFAIDRSARTVAVDLQAPKKVKPGATLPIHFQTSRPGRIVVYAVDEGILQVAGYDTPGPLDFFLRKRALEVRTAQIADLLMPEFELLRERLAAGGGQKQAAPALERNLNPFQRNVKAPVVYWSGIIEATGAPQTVHYTVPDYFDGQLRLMAVAVADDAVGAAEAHALVRGPFVLRPNVITTAAPGDEFEVSVGVTNALPAGSGTAEITVRLGHDAHLEIVGAAAKTLTLAPGREGRITFRVRATDTVGAAELVFHATAGRHSLKRTATLSVRPAVPYRTTLAAGSSSSGEVEVDLARVLKPALAEQRSALGYSPLILAGGLRAYLNDYPYGCTEQLVSRVFPLLGLLDEPALALDRREILARYRDLVSILRVRQLPDGGFAFWPGGERLNAFASIYVMHFLTDAEAAGAAVPARLRATGLDYLRGIAATDPARTSVYLQAYAIYVLTRNGEITTNYLTRLQEYLERVDSGHWRQTRVAAFMAAAYRQLQLSDLAAGLIDDYVFSQPATTTRGIDSALAHNAQYLYLLARHFPARLAKLGGKPIRRLTQAIGEGRYNSLSAAYTMLALGAWSEAAADRDLAPLRISAQVGEELRTLVESGGSAVHTAVPLEVRQLHLSGDPAARLFYAVTQSGYNARLPEGALSQGLEIIREYVNDAGKVVTEVPQGSELTARIRVRALGGRYLNNVAIVALLPGGFEVQRDSLRGDARRQADYVDIREDRVVLYTGVGPEVRTFSYRVQVTGEGSFVVPPVYAEAMYAPRTQAHSEQGRFTVTAP